MNIIVYYSNKEKTKIVKATEPFGIDEELTFIDKSVCK